MTREKNGRITFDESEELYIVSTFVNNEKSIRAIAKEFNTSRSVIVRILKKHNIDIESSSNKHGRKYFFDEFYFDEIDSEAKAYWFGFLYADGFLSNGNMIGCRLNSKDEKHLLLFLNDIHISKNLLSYNKKTDSCGFLLTSQKMYDSLFKKGFSQKKSYDNTSLPFECIKENLKKYFILGFLDGDGYVSFSSKGKQLAGIVSNNEELIKAFVKYINIYMGEDFCRASNTDGYFRIRLATNKAKYFLDWLYKDSCIHLDRKYETYLQMKIGTKAHIGFNNYLSKGILCIDSGRMYITAKECCIGEFGINNPGAINNIRACCRGERLQTRGKNFRYLTECEREILKCQV